MNKILFSFGNWHYYITLEVLGQSAKEKGNVDKVFLFKESDIDPYFYRDHAQHFRDGRGFGYWVWKAYFITRLLKTAADDDVFFYVDAGNDVIADLTPLYEICQKNEQGIILFENTDGEPTGNVWKNDRWTKSDCFNLMNLKTPEYITGDQVNAAYMVFRKTDFSLTFFNLFLNYCENYNIISDAPNITENFNTAFQDHRHDQSILSLLSILHKITILRDPCQWGNHRDRDREKYGQLFNHHRRNNYI
jgi:hypothetical protein